MIRKINISLMILISSLLLYGSNCYAYSAGYTVKPVHNKQQIDKNASYFDLRVSPEEKGSLTLEIHNVETKPLDISIEPFNAGTNSNGVITYNKKPVEDNSSNISFTSLISEKQKIRLEPEEIKQIQFDYSIPKESFDGMILGGFRISEDSNEDKGINNEAVTIENRVEFEISVKFTETDVTIEPNLNLLTVSAGLKNYRTTIIEKIQNDSAAIVKNLSIKTSIYKKNSLNKPILTYKKDNMKMAPNSTMMFPVSMGGERFKAGKYVAKIEANAHESLQWNLNKEFTITAEEAKKYNEDALNINKQENNFENIILIGVLIIVIFIILFLLFMNRKKHKKDDSHKTNKRKIKHKKKRR